MLSSDEFEQIAAQALAELPEELAQKVENLDVMIEDYPGPEVLDSPGFEPRGLLGLYSGVPQKWRGHDYGSVLPDRIYLYKKNLEAISSSLEDLKENIRRTVFHEIGHYFGLSDRRLRELGF